MYRWPQAGKQHAPEHAEEVTLDRPGAVPQRDEKHHADLLNDLLHDEQDEVGVAAILVPALDEPEERERRVKKSRPRTGC